MAGAETGVPSHHRRGAGPRQEPEGRPGRTLQVSEGAGPAGTLIVDSWPPDWERACFCPLKLPSVGLSYDGPCTPAQMCRVAGQRWGLLWSDPYWLLGGAGVWGCVCTHMCACGSQPCSGKAQVLRVMFKYQHQSSPRGARQAEPRCRHNKGLVTAIFSQGPWPGCLGPTALRLRRCGPGGCWCGGGGRGRGENPGWSLAQQAPWFPRRPCLG